MFFVVDMGKRQECDANCICACCAKVGDRYKCTCKCNKCDCARRRHHIKVTGVPRKRKVSPTPHFKLIVEDASLYMKSSGSSSSSKVQPKKPTKPKQRMPDTSAKRAEEMMHHFCYNEELATASAANKVNAHIDSTESDPIDDRRGLYCLCLGRGVTECLFL